jgi:hypothetical protein
MEQPGIDKTAGQLVTGRLVWYRYGNHGATRARTEMRGPNSTHIAASGADRKVSMLNVGGDN